MTPPVGLYSIGIRGLDVAEVLTFAAANQVPFVHLRGGPRGYDLARRDDLTLSRWARHARASVPITLVTADLDITHFQPTSPSYRHACTELDRLGRASALLGAHAVRLLARHPARDAVAGTVTLPDLQKRHGLAVLVELHDPGWFTPGALIAVRTVCDNHAGVGLLIDSGQVHEAWSTLGALDGLVVAELVARASVVHLCDNGCGLGGTGHHTLAAATAAGSAVEVGFEWTGPDRSPAGCMARYHAAVCWWQHTRDAS
ncbi:MAG TPA: hypothetical protein VIY28_18605 [Pseudonocardiaceae bacterium]